MRPGLTAGALGPYSIIETKGIHGSVEVCEVEPNRLRLTVAPLSPVF